MGLKEVLDAIVNSGISVSVKIEGKEALSVSSAEKQINVEIKDAESIGKILKNLKPDEKK